MRVLVTGRHGQVAHALAERMACSDGLSAVFAARPELDLADPDSIRRTIAAHQPDVVISAAAYTAVDLAEDEPEAAHALNAVAPGVIAQACRAAGARLLHLSTDYVFSGEASAPYREDDATAPLGVYGRTKLLGEEAVRQALPDAHMIARTAWVYSPFGKNFVKTMLRLAETRDELAIVADQYGNPTSAFDIADGLLAVLDTWRDGSRTGLGETYHLAGSGEASWYDLASHVLNESAALGGPAARVRPIPASDYPTRARRPANSRLDTGHFTAAFGYAAPDWRPSSAAVVARLLSGQAAAEPLT